ncbi:MAG TPA: amino acid adenylation domain-containing protein, partial [Pyrinomonadaceae bacterium]
MHELFAQQVEHHSDRVAVVCGNEALSYSALNARAERLAVRLRQMGIGPESRVGLLLERSVEVVVGILGVLKAGGAYVPLEVGYPDERLRYVVEDAGLALVVTYESEAERVRSLGAEPVLLEENTDEREVGEARISVHGLSRENLCYVIYTSGSTGRPKGVMVTHGQLLNYVRVVQARLGLSEGLSYGLLTTFAADLGHTVTFPALCTGGCLHVVATEVALEAKRLSAYLKEHEIECLKMVPSQLSALVRSGERVLPQSRLVLGGEALTEGLVEQVIALAQGTELVLYNHYGPTETTVGAVAGRVWQAGENRAEMKAGTAAVALGRALGNTSVYVVDRSGEVVPQGVAGEVYIGGEGVARGYLERPELTAERFIPDEFSSEAGARLYRTGDLARYRADGDLEFLGRIDNQVKIRGYRIELGEIEAALCAMAGVREAVVVTRPDAQGEQRLVAYVVGEASGLDQGTLRRELGARLPDYMVPSAIVELDQLPLTANGKVNRRALPEPEHTRQGSEYAAARTPVEELLCGIWAEVLGVERVGVDDNFFELGGHSLLATQVISRINSAFAVEIPVGSLFDARTVHELAQRVESEMRAGKGVTAPPIVAVNRDRELPLSFAQQRLWFLDQLEPGTSLYNIFKAVRLDGVLDMKALEAALNEIINRHEALRTTFDAIDGRPRQSIAAAKPVALKIEDLNGVTDDERETEVLRLAHEESVRPFDLTQGPLLRVRLLRLNDEEHVMLFTMHHIIGDAWSIALLVRELATLYRAFHLGTPPSLPQLPVQYADYAVWQREWLQSAALDKHVSFWKEQLANAPPVLELPTVHRRPEVTSLEGARHAAVISEESARALEAFSRSKGVTLFMTLLAAFKILLHYQTKCDDIVIGTDVANRNHLETESVCGFFINHLVLRTNLSGDPVFNDVLKSVRKTVWDAYAHQELPFDRLVEVLNPKRSLKYSPLFQVKFIFQNTERVGDDEETELAGLRLSGLPVEGNTSKFDLTLNANRRPDALVYWIEYKTSLFNASTIARFAEQFEFILSHVVSRPESRLSEIEEALADADRQRRARQEQNLKESRLNKFR